MTSVSGLLSLKHVCDPHTTPDELSSAHDDLGPLDETSSISR
jgi:hypothetical protein